MCENRPFTMLEPLAVTVGLVVLNLALYSAYNKRTKALDAGLLLDIALLRKGVEHTLVEVRRRAANGTRAEFSLYKS